MVFLSKDAITRLVSQEPTGQLPYCLFFIPSCGHRSYRLIGFWLVIMCFATYCFLRLHPDFMLRLV